jgi:hypothetical protein
MKSYYNAAQIQSNLKPTFLRFTRIPEFYQLIYAISKWISLQRKTSLKTSVA